MNKLQAAYKILTTRSLTDGLNNLFGSIAGQGMLIPTSKAFIPTDGNGGTLDVGGTGFPASWLGLRSKNMQYWAYLFCSPLAGVIDRLAEADTNGRIGLVDEDYKPRKSYSKNPALYRVMNLLKTPNPTQTWEEFNSEQVAICKIFGYCPVFAITPAGFDKTFSKSLWNINPFFATPEFYPRGDYDSYFFADRPQTIKCWRFNILGKEYEIPSEDIMLLEDGFIDNNNFEPGLPLSKVAGLDYFISNICAAMEADNVLLRKKGPLGIFSYDPKPDMAGSTPLTPQQKDDVQADLSRYGLTFGQLQYVVSKIPLKWNSMSFNVQELMTKETVRQGIEGICDRFGYPAELMSGKNATYENRNSAEKFLYQNNIIPFTIRRMSKYDAFFNIRGLTLFYDHLPVLQEDIQKAAEAQYSLSRALDIEWKSDIITRNEYRLALKMEPVSDGEIYYSEYAKLNPLPDAQPKAQPTPAKTNGVAKT